MRVIFIHFIPTVNLIPNVWQQISLISKFLLSSNVRALKIVAKRLNCHLRFQSLLTSLPCSLFQPVEKLFCLKWHFSLHHHNFSRTSFFVLFLHVSLINYQCQLSLCSFQSRHFPKEKLRSCCGSLWNKQKMWCFWEFFFFFASLELYVVLFFCWKTFSSSFVSVV